MELNKPLDIVLSGLMRRYKDRVPDVAVVLDGLVSAGVITNHQDIENDHIAFRTLGVANLGIASFEKIFLSLGYQKRDYYDFKAKKLNAFWYSPPEDKLPRIFVSELRVSELSPEAQEIIAAAISGITSDPVDSLDLNSGEEIDQFLHQPLWQPPTLSDYKTLQAESEYAAWVIYNRYYLNHFTVSVHNLPQPYCKLEEFNNFVKSLGLKLNTSGGEIKTSTDGLLRQSASVAGLIQAEFRNSAGESVTEEISGSYVEFAERAVLSEFSSLPQGEIKREHRRDGFETGNADKIFESTYSSQTKSRKSRKRSLTHLGLIGAVLFVLILLLLAMTSGEKEEVPQPPATEKADARNLAEEAALQNLKSRLESSGGTGAGQYFGPAGSSSRASAQKPVIESDDPYENLSF